jgi:transcriptional regulator with XRE-family HTH domain
MIDVTTDVTFAKWLREQLDERHMSAATLARLTGLTKAAISRYVLDRSIPNVDSCSRLAIALGMTTQEVLLVAHGLSVIAGWSQPTSSWVACESQSVESLRAERIVAVLQRRPDLLSHWLDIGEALTNGTVVGGNTPAVRPRT